MPMGVIPSPIGTASRIRAENVVVEDQMVVAEVFDRLHVVTKCARVGARLGLRKYDAKSHLEITTLAVSRQV